MAVADVEQLEGLVGVIRKELADKFELGEGKVMVIEDVGDNWMMVLNKRILF